MIVTGPTAETGAGRRREVRSAATGCEQHERPGLVAIMPPRLPISISARRRPDVPGKGQVAGRWSRAREVAGSRRRSAGNPNAERLEKMANGEIRRQQTAAQT